MISSYFMVGSKANSKLSYFIGKFHLISTPPGHVCIEHDGFEPWISGASNEPQIICFQRPSRHHKQQEISRPKRKLPFKKSTQGLSNMLVFFGRALKSMGKVMEKSCRVVQFLAPLQVISWTSSCVDPTDLGHCDRFKCPLHS